MRMLLAILLFASMQSFGQTFNNDTTMTGIYNAGGKVMYINAKISGTVTINNAIIVANPFMQIFDTTVSIGTNIQCERFSAMWFGANSLNADNTRQLQYAINATKDRGYPMYIPTGQYKTSQMLLVASPNGSQFYQTSIRIYGDASFWDNGSGSEIVYSGDSCALGLQVNKGTEISHLILTGKWQSPGGSDTSYFNLNDATFTNQAAHGNGVGLWIDPIGSYSQRSGSTGCYFHDLKIQNFQKLIQISNTFGTQNGEIMQFDRVQLGDGKYGIVTSQAQEKYNRFNSIYSWGSLLTLFTIRNGNYYIDGGNVAGRCINLFDISNQYWFPTHIQNFYAENIGRVGTFATLMPLSISNCVFDFNSPQSVGNLTLITNTPVYGATSNSVIFNSCDFRYYGVISKLIFSGPSTFNNCDFSGAVQGAAGSIFINYFNGTTTTSGSQVTYYQMPIIDTISKPSVKLSIRSSNP